MVVVVIGWNGDWLDKPVLALGWRVGMQGELVGWKYNGLLPEGLMENQ